MSNGFGLRVLACGAALCCSIGAHAATVWDEVSNGDLSDSGLSPTSLAAAIGANLVKGSVGNSGAGIDRDYFSFVVPAGATLGSIRLLESTSVSGGASFIAIQAGAQLTVTPSGVGVEQLLGFTHYGNAQIGTDILPAMAVTFTGALPAGTYSVWVQETGGPATYGLDFMISPLSGGNLSAVPEPQSHALLLAGLVLLGFIARGDKAARRSNRLVMSAT
jgi:hypothetical protein